MGHIYSKYLSYFGMKWEYYDPYIPGSVNSLTNLKQYSHIIISSPSDTHYECYTKVMELGFNGYLYIDKPIVICKDHLHVFEYDKLFCGMTERYNPVVIELKEILNPDNLTSLRFTRYSTYNTEIPVIFDLGIHDLDIYLQCMNIDELPIICDVFEKTHNQCIVAKQNNILSTFEWSHESHKRERKIIALQKDAVYEVNMIDQTILAYEDMGVIRNLHINKTQPIREVIYDFIQGKSLDAKLSHQFMFQLIGEK